MIDFKKELQNYPPIDLNKLSESNPDMPDNIKNSIMLYNKALEKFRFGSEDIAIIELRKAISLNPDFYEAYNLLGVFYIYTKDYDNAAQVFKKVIEAEKNSIIALNYLKKIDSSYEAQINKQGKEKKEKTKDVKGRGKSEKAEEKSPLSLNKVPRKKDYSKKIAAGTLIGFILGSLVVFAISFKYYSREDNADIINQLTAEKEAATAKINEYEKKYNELNEKYNGLNVQFEEVNKQLDYYLGVSKILNIEKLASENKITEAADEIMLLKNKNFEGIEKDRFDKLVKDIMPKAAQNEYNAGRDLFNKKDYQGALDRFLKAKAYSDDWKNSASNLYHCGICYQELNNNTMAIKVFQELIEKYPSTSFAQYSQNRINQIQNNQ
ncbi:MAG TPA: tetratricopeptide repeat protein [Acetivibrio sp.]|nr:tetratricopeptide repeat protein [Clostridium sp.]HOQ36755.1 tetratricopeptide repeat protein [Acetivibrio sp.]HQA56767.1 tetratricopeptide repeat protein [Acetivibrio sp.]